MQHSPPFRINPDRFVRIDMKVTLENVGESFTMAGTVDPADPRYYRFDFTSDHPAEWNTKYHLWKGQRKLRDIFATCEWRRSEYTTFHAKSLALTNTRNHGRHQSYTNFVLHTDHVPHFPNGVTYTAIYNHKTTISEAEENEMWERFYWCTGDFQDRHSKIPLAVTNLDFNRIGHIEMWSKSDEDSKIHIYRPSKMDECYDSFMCVRTNESNGKEISAHLTHIQLREMLWVRKNGGFFEYEDKYSKVVAFQAPPPKSVRPTYDGGVWF